MVDTNIIVSLVVFNNEQLMSIFVNISKNHKLILSSYIIEETFTVFNKKFPTKIKDLTNFFNNYNYELIYYYPFFSKYESNIKIRDKNDVPILTSALIAKADILITGDKDFDGIYIKGLNIMTLREFYDKYVK